MEGRGFSSCIHERVDFAERNHDCWAFFWACFFPSLPQACCKAVLIPTSWEHWVSLSPHPGEFALQWALPSLFPALRHPGTARCGAFPWRRWATPGKSLGKADLCWEKGPLPPARGTRKQPSCPGISPGPFGQRVLGIGCWKFSIIF